MKIEKIFKLAEELLGIDENKQKKRRDKRKQSVVAVHGKILTIKVLYSVKKIACLLVARPSPLRPAIQSGKFKP